MTCEPTNERLHLLTQNSPSVLHPIFGVPSAEMTTSPYSILLLREVASDQGNLLWIPKLSLKKKKLLKFNELWAVIPSTTILELPLSGALSPQQLQGSNSEATVGDCECTESLPVCATRDVENSNAENSLHFYLLDKKKNLFHFHWLTFK